MSSPQVTYYVDATDPDYRGYYANRHIHVARGRSTDVAGRYNPAYTGFMAILRDLGLADPYINYTNLVAGRVVHPTTWDEVHPRLITLLAQEMHTTTDCLSVVQNPLPLKLTGFRTQKVLAVTR